MYITSTLAQKSSPDYIDIFWKKKTFCMDFSFFRSGCDWFILYLRLPSL